GAAQYGDAVFAAAGPCCRGALQTLADERDNFLNLTGPRRLSFGHFFLIILNDLWDEAQVKLEGWAGMVSGCPRRACRRELDAAAVALREHQAEETIKLGDQRRGGAEVSRELHAVKEERLRIVRAQARHLYARKQLSVGIAEKINGLHRVADDEAGAVLAIGPGSDERREQLVLAAAGVLKFIHQQVAYVVYRRERRFDGQAVVGAKNRISGLRYFDEIHRTGLGE